MARTATVYEVFIASPSDVIEERSAAAEVVEAWNRAHADAEQVHLRCLRWEQDATPEQGARPQDILNRQLVDRADVVVAIFWSKVGTSTALASSGTQEEINRAVESKKQVLLYFSERSYPVDVDLKGIETVRALRVEYQGKGLYATYKSLQEFKDKLQQHLSTAVHRLKANGLGPAPGPAHNQDDLLVLAALAEHRDANEDGVDLWSVALSGVELALRTKLTPRRINDAVEILSKTGDVSVRPHGAAERGGSPFQFQRIVISAQGYRRLDVGRPLLPGRRIPPPVYVAEDYPDSTGLIWDELRNGFRVEWVTSYLVPARLDGGADIVEKEVSGRSVHLRIRAVPAECVLVRVPVRSRTLDEALALVREKVDKLATIKTDDGELIIQKPRTVGGGLNRPPVFITQDTVGRGKTINELLANLKIALQD